MKGEILTFIACMLCSAVAVAEQLLLFGGPNHDEFLGCLNCPKYDSASICNKYGKGSKYGEGIFGRYSRFGHKYANSSPWNKFTTDNGVPGLVDESGSFFGSFTINHFRADAVSFSKDLRELFEAVDGDLEIVRDVLCESL